MSIPTVKKVIEKVLLLNPPGDKPYLRDGYCSAVAKGAYYWPPTDLLILSGIIYGSYNLKLIDAIAQKLSQKRCLELIRAYTPDATIFLTGSGSLQSDLSFAKKIKDITGSLLIANGEPTVHRSYEILKKHPYIDAALQDFTSANINRYLSGKLALPIEDVTFRIKDNILKGPRSAKKEFSIPTPRHELLQIQSYEVPWISTIPITSVVTSYSCPYSCAFCVPGTLNYKSRPISEVIEELRHIKQLKIKGIYFLDPLFTADKKRTITLCNLMQKENLRFRWSCLSRVDCVDEPVLIAMKRSGCENIQFGVESGNDIVLKNINKGFTREDVKKAFRLCRKIGIRADACFILGLSGDTYKTILQTIEFAKELDCNLATFQLPMPFSGTKLRSQAKEQGLIKGDEEFFDDESNPVMGTKDLDPRKLLELKSLAYRRFYFRPSYIIRKLISIKSLYEAKTLIKEGANMIRKA